jgi:hypothetical protein
MRGKTRTDTQLKFKSKENTTLLYGSEAWVRRDKEENTIKAAEMRGKMDLETKA